MSQIGKLYKFYLKKTLKKNLLRTIIISFLVGGLWWFISPYMYHKNYEGKMKLRDGTKIISFDSFQDYSRIRYESEEVQDLWKRISEKKKSLIKKLDSTDDKHKKNEIIKEISSCEIDEKGGTFGGIGGVPFTADLSHFFSRNEKYWKGLKFWKLINNITWWGLFGSISLFWLLYSVIDSIFFDPLKNGEESMVVSLTPGVKRSEIFLSKILAFLTYFSITNVLMFLAPFGFYYFWAGTNHAWGGVFLLALWSCFIGLALFFSLVLSPYILLKYLSRVFGWMFSLLISFFPLIWTIIKLNLISSSWPYSLEKTFFHPIWFTIISLTVGVISLSLVYWKYKKEDLLSQE